ncbi:MAG: S41 family peptidase [Roseiflexaceae bacterium]
MSDSQPAARPYMRTPVISPDGGRIAFVYAGDIWVVDAHGGDAERLTAHPAGHLAPRWSPDGERIAFTSGRTGTGDLYVLPLRGGEVRRVTYHDSVSTMEAWSHDGAQLFFSSYRGQQSSAIYRVDAAGGTPVPWASQPYESLMHLSVAPDGQRLAFNLVRDPWWRRGPNPYGGSEVWVASNAPDASDFQRLCADYIGMNRWPVWSPDGAGLYLVSDRDGAENLYYQPLDSGAVRQITHFHEGRLLWPSISADGRTVVFERDFGPWRMDVASGDCTPISVRLRPDTKLTPVRVYGYTRELSELALAPDGKKVAFVARGEIFADFADKETDKERRQGPSFRVTSTSFREHDIFWAPDSRRLAFISDRHGDGEVYLYDFVSRSETRLTADVTGTSAPRFNPQFSPDGRWIAYARGDEEIRLLEVATRNDRSFARAAFTYGTHFAWSPDSHWLVYIAQDERLFSNLYIQQIDSTEARQITFLSNLAAYHPIWAPNGLFIVFTTAQYRAESQIARVDLHPQPPQFREEEFEKLFGHDERAAPREETQPSQEQGMAVDPPEAEGENEDEAPATEEPAPPTKPLAPDFEGIERRLRFLTQTQLDAAAHCISPDSRDLIFNATVAGKTNLWSLPLDEPREDQPPRQLTAGSSVKSAAQFAPDGKSFYFLDGGQIAIRKFPGGDQSTLGVYAEVVVDFNQEKRQMFEECWRLLRDHFYDPTFRGLDWSAARAQFAPLAAGAQTSGDLVVVLNLMVGELRASHLGAFPGGGASQDGYIGLLFDPVAQATEGRLRVAGVVPDSPAALAGLKPGDELLAVNGVTLGPGINLDALLQRTVGRRVRLTIAESTKGTKDTNGSEHEEQASNLKPQASGSAKDTNGSEHEEQASNLKPQASGSKPQASSLKPQASSREVAVRPVSAGMYSGLRYRAWVYANEAYVHRVSGGRLGYVHIRAMSYDAYQQFLADLDAEAHGKAGVVIDVRFNGGGHIATFILDVLARRSVLLTGFRNRPSADAAHISGNRVLNKPTVLVINEHSSSNTEMLTESYRRMGLGTVVGRPTAGAVIWTFEYTLLDGTRFRLPRFKVATPEGEDLEGTGRPPDVDVALPLGAAAHGRDPQLDTAVATLLAQIDQRSKKAEGKRKKAEGRSKKAADKAKKEAEPTASEEKKGKKEGKKKK